MRRFAIPLFAVFCFGILSADAATGRIIKVLPLFLDLQGQHMRAANLYDRDAYQVYLRKHPAQRSGIRFDVQWKISDKKAPALKLKLEIRGGQRGGVPQRKTLEVDATPGRWFSAWTSLPLLGADYKEFGEVVAWRATLWEGDMLVDEQRSFLW